MVLDARIMWDVAKLQTGRRGNAGGIAARAREAMDIKKIEDERAQRVWYQPKDENGRTLKKKGDPPVSFFLYHCSLSAYLTPNAADRERRVNS